MRIRHTVFYLLFPFCLSTVQAMSLQQAEDYAVANSSEIKSLSALSEAQAEQAIADGQLADPQISFGAANVPTNNFSFTQNNMTQVQLGISQQFPKGHTLSLTTKQENLMVQESKTQLALMRLEIVKQVREGWLSLYYWQHVVALYKAQDKVFQHWLMVTKAKLSNGQAQQSDVVRAQLEISKLHQLILNGQKELAQTEAQLSRWLGSDLNAAKVALAEFASPATLEEILTSIKTHPQLQVNAYKSQESLVGIELAEQKYKPGFGVGLMYGLRQGDDSSGDARSDFVGASITMDIPLMTANRQDKALLASQDSYVGAQADEQAAYKFLMSEAKNTYASYQLLQEQNALYQRDLLKQADYYAQATEISYQNQQTDFLTLVRAYIEQYQTQLDAVKAQVDERRAQVELLYLQGE